MKAQGALQSGTRAVLFLLIIVCAVQVLSRCSGLRVEVGRFKVARLENSTRAQLDKLQDTVFVTYYTSAPARMPAHMGKVERSVKALLQSMKAAAPVRFQFRIVDPDSDPDLRSYASRRGVAPFRARHVSRDSYSEQSVWSALTIEYGSREPAVVHAVGPEHLSRLQSILVEHLRHLQSPRRPLFALAGPSAFSTLRDALAMRGAVVEVDLDGGAPIPENADLLFWMEPAALGPDRLREIDRFLERGHSVVLAASRHQAAIRQSDALFEVRFQQRAYAAELLLLEFGLQPLKNLVLDGQAQELVLNGGLRTAPFLIRCLAYEQDFHTLRGQPNGNLLFSAPTPFAVNSDRLSARSLSAEVLATTSQATWTTARRPRPA